MKPDRYKDECLPTALQNSTSFHTCMAHFYRGEMNRMTVWRMRIDQTTHWSIILTVGLTTFSLGSAEIPHYIMLLGLTFNCIFMFIEARRFLHLHHSKWRLNLLEHNYFADQLSSSHSTHPVEETWRAQLIADLQKPHFTCSAWMAVRMRLRRNYLMLMYFITFVWLTKVFIHPASTTSWQQFYERLAVGALFPSWFVAVTASLFIVGVSVTAAFTPSEEELERWSKQHHFNYLSHIERQTP